MPKSPQLAGDVRAHHGDTWVCGHQPLSNCSVGPGSREALIGVVGNGEPGEACLWIYGDMCSLPVHRLDLLGCHVPMSPQLSLLSLLRNLSPLCAGTSNTWPCRAAQPGRFNMGTILPRASKCLGYSRAGSGGCLCRADPRL